MKPTPPGWPRISTAAFYEDPQKAIDFLVRAFGFEVRLKVEGDDGDIVHSELVFGDGVVMVATAGGSKAQAEAKKRDTAFQKSPKALGGANTQTMMLYVEDVEAHETRARAAGAHVTMPITTSDYGEEYWSDKSYEAVDLEGHHWWFVQRLRTGKGT
jgi:uncharacterized glyoxalase superfamily protein PhnB